MAMVIDDRLQVWNDKDQPHVHVVPPFTPYYAPQAEMANVVPVLCVARNVACNVRTGFFREFEENLLGKIFEIRYENETSDLPCSPDVSSYLVSEDKSVMQNNIQEPPIPAESMTGPEVEERLRQAESRVFSFVCWNHVGIDFGFDVFGPRPAQDFAMKWYQYRRETSR